MPSRFCTGVRHLPLVALALMAGCAHGGTGYDLATHPASPSPSVAERIKPSVVRVRNLGCGVGIGSGLVIDQHDFVTNAHVIEGRGDIQVNLWDGTLLHGRIQTASVQRDLAIVRVDGSLPAPPPQDDETTVVARPVLIAGFPLAEAFTVTTGQETGTDRILGFTSYTLDAPILPGNSGGPVLSQDGKVIGIVNAKDLVHHRAFAIPIDDVEKLQRGTIQGTAVVECGETERALSAAFRG